MINPIRAEDVAVPVFITQAARQFAAQFAAQQPNEDKAQQVRLNTLAVCAVNNYLKILGIPSDLSNCDSWNPLMRMTTNVADLEVVGRGKLECRPVSLPEQEESGCYIPTEVQGDRIAYVIVQIDPKQPEALILGFIDQVDSETLPLTRLRPLSDLPMYLKQYNSQPFLDRLTQLTHWLQGQIGADWRSLDEVLGITSLNYQWRSASTAEAAISCVMRGKVIELPTSRGIERIVLIAELIPKAETDLAIELKVAPTTEQEFLPVGLEMTVLDAAGEPVMYAQARDQNRTIELGFQAELGDRFSLQIVLGKVSLSESFMV